jgi:hypothetical protein
MARVADFGQDNYRHWVQTEHKDEVALAAKGIGWGQLDGGEFRRRIEHVGCGAEKGKVETVAQCADMNGKAMSAGAVDALARDDDLALDAIALVGEDVLALDTIAPLLCIPAVFSAAMASRPSVTTPTAYVACPCQMQALTWQILDHWCTVIVV